MLLFCDVHVGEVCESKWSYVLDVLMLTLSDPVELLFLLCFIEAWTCVVVSVRLVVCSLIMFDCVGELFVECVCYLCV